VSCQIELNRRSTFDVISVEHYTDTKKIAITILNGDFRPGSPGYQTYVQLNKEEAEWLANELLRRVKELRK
jgi:hypothetical protein